MAEPEVRIEHPSRRKASKLTRAIVVLLLLVSAVLVAVVTVGGFRTDRARPTAAAPRRQRPERGAPTM